MPPPSGSRWPGWPPGLRPPETFLAEATGILVATRALTLALSLAVGLALTLDRPDLCPCCGAAPCAAGPRRPRRRLRPFPPAVRRKEDSILDSCCSLSYVRLPAGRGTPTFVNRTCWPSLRTSSAQHQSRLRLESSLKSNQLRPSGARNSWREERLHGKCGDWRTSLSYPALRLKRKPPTAVNTLDVLTFVNPGII